jgi:hypothetical protein
MANYLKYNDVPIFADFSNENSTPSKNYSSIFAAYDASLNLENIITPNKYLGRSPFRKEYAVTGPMEGKFSMTFVPLIEKNANQKLQIDKTNQLDFFKLTGDFVSGHNIYFSSFLLKRSYLQNYSIKINPLQPISVSANFISYDIYDNTNQEFSGVKPAGDLNLNPNNKDYEGLHAVTTTVVNTSVNIPSTKLSVEINVDCNRTPVYEIGSRIPSRVMLNSVERVTTIQGENIGKLYDNRENTPTDLVVSFLPYSSITYETPSIYNNVLNFIISGIVSSQQISANQNSPLNGKVVIKENIL